MYFWSLKCQGCFCGHGGSQGCSSELQILGSPTVRHGLALRRVWAAEGRQSPVSASCLSQPQLLSTATACSYRSLSCRSSASVRLLTNRVPKRKSITISTITQPTTRSCRSSASVRSLTNTPVHVCSSTCLVASLHAHNTSSRKEFLTSNNFFLLKTRGCKGRQLCGCTRMRGDMWVRRWHGFTRAAGRARGIADHHSCSPPLCKLGQLPHVCGGVQCWVMPADKGQVLWAKVRGGTWVAAPVQCHPVCMQRGVAGSSAQGHGGTTAPGSQAAAREGQPLGCPSQGSRQQGGGRGGEGRTPTQR